ncbi:MAG TPA: SRPBCC family protein [Steroidobacteraceae bacterium]
MANESTGTRPDLSPPPPPHPYSPAGSFAPYSSGARPYSSTRSEFAIPRRIAAGVGWFGIGLGLFQLAAPRTLARLIGLEAPRTRWLEAPRTSWRGVRRMRAAQLLPRTRSRVDPVHSMIIRGLGLRAILSGIGILARPRPTPWLWTRVVGGMMDLSLLGLALNSKRRDRARLAGATAAVAGVTALDIYASIEFTRAGRSRRLPLTVARTLPLEAGILINRPPEECYRFWHDFENLPRFMRSIESVRVESDRRSHWVARAPGGIRLEWDSEIVDDTPDRMISWHSLNADVPNAGSVHFDPAPGGRGTFVRVRMSHDMPTLSGIAARVIGKVPKRQVKEDLRRFKQIMETGEIPTTRGQPSGRRSYFARRFSGDSAHEG